jgi:chaperone required for assembly of F1-ATPase
MKRQYRLAAATNVESGWGVALDGKPLMTPAKRLLVLPSLALAEALAAEWQSQGDAVDPDTMPMTRLASIAIDLVAPRRPAILTELTNYAGTDLLCYRAEHPPELAARQQAIWQPLVDWAILRYDAPLVVTSGVIPVAQAPESLRAFAAALDAYEPMLLTALHAAVTACGSLIIGLALLEGRLDAEAAFAAAQLDESFQIERWGEDPEQTSRRAALRADIAAAAQFAELVRV